MKTKHLTTSEEELRKAASILRDGGLVAFPTETVYGLGADGLCEEAVKKIFVAKGRPSDNPLILHIASVKELENIVADISDISYNATKLMKAFWPGPLTLVLKANERVPLATRGGLDTVGIRMPSNEIAKKIIEFAGVPIAAPSANTSGRPSPTKFEHVAEDLDGKIDAIVCGESADIGLESTVVSAIGDEITILRPGKISKADIENVLGIEIEIDRTLMGAEITGSLINGLEHKKDKTSDKVYLEELERAEFKPLAPGMKYRHYAPKAKMYVYEGDAGAVRKSIAKDKKFYEAKDLKVEVLDFLEISLEEVAATLFDRLRECDKKCADIILATSVGTGDIGFAIMNRMLKAAGGNVRKVCYEDSNS